MPRMLRALFLLLLMGVGQADTALALACEPEVPAGHTHCAAQHADDRQPGSEQPRVPHDEAPARGAQHDGPSCAAMLSCGAAVALPGAPGLTVRTTQGAEARSIPLLPPASRAHAPRNPPPRA